MEEKKVYNVNYRYDTGFYSLMKSRKFLKDLITYDANVTDEEIVILNNAAEVLKLKMLALKPDAKIW